MPFDLRAFELTDMLRCGMELRRIGREGQTLEDSAEAVVRFLHANAVETDAEGAPRRSCVLVRFYKTHAYEALPAPQQEFARRLLGSAAPAPGLQCLTLVATAGEEREWNSRHRSHGHQAIPLASEEVVRKAPMIAQLIEQFGLDVADVIDPTPENVIAGRGTSVFHVPEAVGSPAIPAQERFVLRYGVRSVLGFGGLLRTGDLFAVILFSRTPIPAETATRFRSIGLDLKSALFAAGDRPVFRDLSTDVPRDAGGLPRSGR